MRTLKDIPVDERSAFILRAKQRAEQRSRSNNVQLGLRLHTALIASAATVKPRAVTTTVGARPAAPQAAPVPDVAPAAPGRSPEETFALACHESAHAVTHVLAGGQIVEAELFPDGGRGRSDGMAGQCHYAPYDLATKQRAHEFFAAGAVAQAVALFGREPTDAQISYLLEQSPDGEDLRQLAQSAGSWVSPKSDVLPLVLQAWPAIEHLAARIQRGPIGHKHVVAALGLSRYNDTHLFEINNIRAGMRPIVPRTL